jgi:hypothetical protein
MIKFRPTFYSTIDLKNATIRIKDGDGHELEVDIGEGNLTFNESRNVEYKLNRGALGTTRLGDEKPVEVSMDFNWEFLRAATADTAPTISEAIKGIGKAETLGWVTSDTEDECAPYCVDLEIEYTPECSDADKEVITLAHFRWESLNHDPKAGSVACTGKCNITEADIQRVAQ